MQAMVNHVKKHSATPDDIYKDDASFLMQRLDAIQSGKTITELDDIKKLEDLLTLNKFEDTHTIDWFDQLIPNETGIIIYVAENKTGNWTSASFSNLNARPFWKKLDATVQQKIHIFVKPQNN